MRSNVRWFVNSLLPEKNSKPAGFHTAFSVEECRARLEKVMTRERWSAWLDPKDYVGSIEGTHLRIRQNHQGRNSWAVTFEGKIVPDDLGTWIDGQFTIPAWVEPFAFLWVLAVLVSAIILWVYTLAAVAQSWMNQGDVISTWWKTGGPAIMVSLMFLFGWVFKISASVSRENHEQALAKLFREKLRAEKIS